MPTLFGAFGNFLLPTQLGVHDVAFPRLNSAAFWFLPGGLIMLAQLVCVDRRYQRMNCFNIRELQSMLKRRFFVDLVNSTEHHTLLNNTMIGLRYKTNSSNFYESDISNFYNNNLTFTDKTKSTVYSTNRTLVESTIYQSYVSPVLLLLSVPFN
jgi:heme/copper-type cytochrome/quinol oxidase subunit 1